jgi:tRNA U54 and U55 pseudouridine synthase Pus10
MLTDKDKAQLLRDAMELLMDADALVQKALGACDVCEDTHNNIQLIVDDLAADVQDLEARAEGLVL